MEPVHALLSLPLSRKETLHDCAGGVLIFHRFFRGGENSGNLGGRLLPSSWNNRSRLCNAARQAEGPNKRNCLFAKLQGGSNVCKSKKVSQTEKSII